MPDKSARKPLNDSLKLVIVLSAIALIASLLLSVVYKFTVAKIDYEARLMEKLSENYSSEIEKSLDINDFSNMDSTEILGAYRAADGAYLILSKSEKAYNAKGIELIVIIKDDKVQKVVKYSAAETPGLGSKALEDSYLKNFEGLNVNAFPVSDGATIVAKTEANSLSLPSYVTGATRSSTGVRLAVTAAVRCYGILKGEVQ